MKVIILGASGFVGGVLVSALQKRGDIVRTASLRDPARAADASDGCDVVVNLAGAPVAERWTEERKRTMASSRVDLPHRVSHRARTRERETECVRQRIGDRLLRHQPYRNVHRDESARRRFSRAPLHGMGSGSPARDRARHARRDRAHRPSYSAKTAACSANSCRSSRRASAVRWRAVSNGIRGFTWTI